MKYHCVDCKEIFGKWKFCLNHVISSGHMGGVAVGRLRRKCEVRVVDEKSREGSSEKEKVESASEARIDTGKRESGVRYGSTEREDGEKVVHAFCGLALSTTVETSESSGKEKKEDMQREKKSVMSKWKKKKKMMNDHVGSTEKDIGEGDNVKKEHMHSGLGSTRATIRQQKSRNVDSVKKSVVSGEKKEVHVFSGLLMATTTTPVEQELINSNKKKGTNIYDESRKMTSGTMKSEESWQAIAVKKWTKICQDYNSKGKPWPLQPLFVCGRNLWNDMTYEVYTECVVDALLNNPTLEYCEDEHGKPYFITRHASLEATRKDSKIIPVANKSIADILSMNMMHSKKKYVGSDNKKKEHMHSGLGSSTRATTRQQKSRNVDSVKKSVVSGEKKEVHVLSGLLMATTTPVDQELINSNQKEGTDIYDESSDHCADVSSPETRFVFMIAKCFPM